MPFSVTMPRLGESVTEGTVTRWLKKEGDQVAVDEPLLEVSTDKVDTEIPSPVAGILSKITVAEDETVEVGSELAVIDDGAAGGARQRRAAAAADSGEAAQTAPVAPAETVPPAEAAVSSVGARSQRPNLDAGHRRRPQRCPRTGVRFGQRPSQPKCPQLRRRRRPFLRQRPRRALTALPRYPMLAMRSYVTPLVRKLAAEHHVDLSALAGTGVGGRIRKQDVIAAAEAREAATAARHCRPTNRTGDHARTELRRSRLARAHREDVAAAQRAGVSHGRVAADRRTVHHCHRSRRHPRRAPARRRRRPTSRRARAPSFRSCRSSRSPPSRR